MKKTVSKYDFERAFFTANREANFSYEAKNLLFDYFEEVEEATGEEIELDVVAICCEYEENDFEYIAQQYDELEDDSTEDEVVEFLEHNTQYIGKTSSGLVYASFWLTKGLHYDLHTMKRRKRPWNCRSVWD